MARAVTVAVTQMPCTWDTDANVANAKSLVTAACDDGAQIVLLQELFETPYFCIQENAQHFSLAKCAEGHPLVEEFRAVAKQRSVVLPISFFEKAGNVYFNSVAVIDADGSVLGSYRKSHIPESPGYHEKFYFSPGDTGFQVWQTSYGCIGVGICWDQWFPEAARAMVLKGAELLFYPTAIGNEPSNHDVDSRHHWQRVMQGHSAANVVPVIAANRVGVESATGVEMTFYGSSFITDHTGCIVASTSQDKDGHVVASIDLEVTERYRSEWGVFRDRRPDLYGDLMLLDGSIDKPDN